MLAQTARDERNWQQLAYENGAVTPPTLTTLGLTKRDSIEAQALAATPEHTFADVKRGALTRTHMMALYRRW